LRFRGSICGTAFFRVTVRVGFAVFFADFADLVAALDLARTLTTFFAVFAFFLAAFAMVGAPLRILDVL
jgi:hypothetical protein